MGDYSCHIKIQFSIMGMEFTEDMSINYSPNGCCDIDQRIIDFFEDGYEKAVEKNEANVAEYWLKRDKKEIAEKERAEYERLKNKFDPPVILSDANSAGKW